MATEVYKGLPDTELKRTGGIIRVQDGILQQGIITKFIVVHPDTGEVYIKLQRGPIKEHGVNGVQIDCAIELFKDIVTRLNDKFPCAENELAIQSLNECLDHMESRKKNREKRGVEGTNRV